MTMRMHRCAGLPLRRRTALLQAARLHSHEARLRRTAARPPSLAVLLHRAGVHPRRAVHPRSRAVLRRRPVRAAVPRRPVRHEIFQRSGPPERFIFAGPPERFFFAGPPERFIFAGPPERFFFTGPPERFFFTGPPERNQLPGSSERQFYPESPERLIVFRTQIFRQYRHIRQQLFCPSEQQRRSSAPEQFFFLQQGNLYCACRRSGQQCPQQSFFTEQQRGKEKFERNQDRTQLRFRKHAPA